MGERCAKPPRMLPLAIAALLLAKECQADWRVVPAVTLSERYTDNYYLESDALKQSQLISTLSPSLRIISKGPRLSLEGRAEANYYHYRDDDILRRTLDHTTQYSLSGQGMLAEDFLYVDASTSLMPRTISAFGPRFDDLPYLEENQVDIKTWRVSPSLQKRFGQNMSLLLRYSRDRVEGGRARGFANSNSDSINASLASGPAFGKLSWGLNHIRRELKDTINGDTSSENTIANLRYAVTPQVGLTATVGYDNYDFASVTGDSGGKLWSLGVDWTPSLRTQLSLAAGRHFYGNTGNLTLTHRSRRSTLNLIYEDNVTTSREQFLLPATLDTSLLLDRLLAPSIPDPVARQHAVEAYIRDAGLPESLTDSINFLSNRYFRQKQLRGQMAMRFARTSALLSLYRNERIALTSQQSDSILLETQNGSRNDNIKQFGANASLSYRLGPRANAVASFDWSRSRSQTIDREDTRRIFRVGLNRELGRHMRASVDLSSRSGTAGRLGLNTGPYREHSITASLTAQL